MPVSSPYPFIGGSILGGTAPRVLFVDTGGTLGDDAGLTYNKTTNTLTGGTLISNEGYLLSQGSNPFIDLEHTTNPGVFGGFQMMSTGVLRVYTDGTQIRMMKDLDLQGVSISGRFIPDLDDSYDIGDSTHAWAGLYLGPDEEILFNNFAVLSQVPTTKHTRLSAPAGSKVTIRDATSVISALFDTGTLATSDKTFTFPNMSGTFALATGVTGGQTLIGGTGTTDDLTFQTTSGVGTTGADFIWKGGNNGATELMRLLNDGKLALTGGQVAFTPTNIISLSGEAAQTIWMERELTAATAGRNLTVQAGGAFSGASNRQGGTLILSSGISTGNQSSQVQIWTAAGGSSGTTDRTPSVKLSIAGNGVATFTQTTSSGNGINQILSSTALNNNSIIGQAWTHTHTGIIDGQAYGLQMGLTFNVSASDTGGSAVQGFGFEIFEDGDHAAGTGAGGQALGGFMRHSSTAVGLGFSAFGADLQANTGAGAADFTLYDTGVSFLGANLTTWTAFKVANPVPSAGTITTAYGLRIDAFTGATTNYAIYVGSGLSVLAGNTRIGSTVNPTVALDVTGASLISSTLGVTGIITASGGITMADAQNIVVNTTTGTKIGTGTTQKLGFWNATPVVQSTGWSVTNETTDKSYDADATSLDEVADVLGTLIETLKTYGILGS